jgi:hypothetical protein
MLRVKIKDILLEKEAWLSSFKNEYNSSVWCNRAPLMELEAKEQETKICKYDLNSKNYYSSDLTLFSVNANNINTYFSKLTKKMVNDRLIWLSEKKCFFDIGVNLVSDRNGLRQSIVLSQLTSSLWSSIKNTTTVSRT